MSDFGETPPNHPSITYMLRRFLRPNTKNTLQPKATEGVTSTQPPIEKPQELRKTPEAISRTTHVGFFSRPGLDRDNKGWRLKRNDDVAYAEKRQNGIAYGFVADGVSSAKGWFMAGKLGSHVSKNSGSMNTFDSFLTRIKNGYQDALKSSQGGRSASTFTGFFVEGNHMRVAHVGDTKLFVLRGGDLRKITEDHQDPYQKNRLTRSINTVQDFPVMDMPEMDLQDGDIIFVCSDGIPEEYVNVKNLKSIDQKINSGSQPHTVLKEFVDSIVDQKSKKAISHVDDASAVFYRHQVSR